nr:hypothetical protein [Tanacetum cinerariifolium]
GGERGHGRAHHHPVGQGRPRRRRAAQGRHSRPWHAQRHSPQLRPDPPPSRPRPEPGQRAGRVPEDLRHDQPGGHGGGVPDRVAGADGDAAAAAPQ